MLLFTHSIMSDSLWPHELQHARPPCPSPSPIACSNSCPLSWWCHPTILSSVVPFSSCLQSFPVSTGQSIGASVSASVLPMSIQDWFPLELTGLITLLSHELSGVFSTTASILWHSAFFMVQLSHPYMIPGKTIALTRWTFVSKVMSLLFNMLFRLVIAFLLRSKHLLISWLQSLFAVIWDPRKIQSVTASIVSLSICHEVMGPDAMIFTFWMLSFKPTFSLSYFLFIKKLFSSSSLAAIGSCHRHICGYWYFSWQSWEKEMATHCSILA